MQSNKIEGMGPPSLVVVVLLLLQSMSMSISSDSDSVYDILRYYGLPAGLIPRDVVSRYELNPNSGEFVVYLNTTCTFTAFHYNVLFRTQISGVIQNQEINNLRGVQVRIFNYWTNIISVEMAEEDEDDIEFSVGYTALDLPASYFFTAPQCGCGFDCA